MSLKQPTWTETRLLYENKTWLPLAFWGNWLKRFSSPDT